MCNFTGEIIMNGRLYSISGGKLFIMYSSCRQNLRSRPGFTVMNDKTVYQMLTAKDSLNIIRLEHWTDCSSKPEFTNTEG